MNQFICPIGTYQPTLETITVTKMSRPADEYPLLPSYRDSARQLGVDSIDGPTGAGADAGSAGPSTFRTLSRIGSRGSSSSKGSPELAGGEWARSANAGARGTPVPTKARMSDSDDGPSKTVCALIVLCPVTGRAG
jgi:hypothetical protein